MLGRLGQAGEPTGRELPVTADAALDKAREVMGCDLGVGGLGGMGQGGGASVERHVHFHEPRR